MFHSKRRHEGYLLNDQRASGGGLVEAAVITCAHCHQQLIVNPLRTRAREYCSKCDHYLCDRCGQIRKQDGGACRNLNAHLEQLHEAAVLALGKG